jgi:hypothetical protein
MKQATRDKLLGVGAKAVTAALSQHGLEGRARTRLPMTAVSFAGEACLSIEACRTGNVLVLERPVARLPDRLMQRLAGIVLRRDLRDIPFEAGDIIVRERDSAVAIPADMADQIADEAAEAQAFEEFTAEQVNQGGGVYGLHIPSGEQARRAFAQWRRMKGR